MQIFDVEHLPHAVLVDSIKGVEALIKQLLCKDKKNESLFNAGSHPDYHVISSEKIKVDEVRDFCQKLIKQPLIAKHQVGIIEHAEGLNIQAANAFLKTLEEPVPNTLIVLITNKPKLLPETILSRCQVLKSNDKTEKTFNNQAAVKQEINELLNNQKSFLEVSESWKSCNLSETLDCLMTVFSEKIKENNGNNIWQAYKKALQVKKDLTISPQLNKQLALENILLCL